MAQSDNSVSQQWNFHQICFCRTKLHRLEDADIDKAWTCNSCYLLCRESVQYQCTGREGCMFKQISGNPFVLCSDCYHRPAGSHHNENGVVFEDQDPGDNLFVFQKVKVSLTAIQNRIDSCSTETRQNRQVLIRKK